MVVNETFSRVRTLHGACGSRDSGSAQRDKRARRGTPQTGRAESESSRTETKKQKAEGRQAPRFLGPRGSVGILVDLRFFSHLAGDFGPRQTPSYDLSDSQIKAVTVG